MDFMTNTEDLRVDKKTKQDNILLDIITELCYEQNGKLSSKLKGKVNQMIQDCNLIHYSSLHKLSTADESTSTLLGYMHRTATELTFEEQAELNLAIIQKIETKLPSIILELDRLNQLMTDGITLQKEKKSLQESLNDKLNLLQEQESEKVELMMEWLNHRLKDVTRFTDNSTKLLTLKTEILEMKSKILHFQILQNIFTETNQSIKAYSEIHKDLKDSIKETELRIQNFTKIIEKSHND